MATISDIDAPHLLRDMARGERIVGHPRTAARLRTLADEVAAIIAEQLARATPTSEEPCHE
jgi:hypothetical protein